MSGELRGRSGAANDGPVAEWTAFDVISEALAVVHDRIVRNCGGQVASYIPPLALADPGDFGLALVNLDGYLYRAGASDTRFTIQSVSKPFVYALALADLGLDEVTRWVGSEPSGEAFNAISLEAGTGRPANPMINAGAIATTALVPAADPDQRFARILDLLGRFAGRPLEVDEEVYRAESATGDRNRALAHLMRSAGSLNGDPVESVETYFRQCSVLVDVADLAVMAGTLANGGVNPFTGEQVVPASVAVQVLAVAATCGMYDASGEWLLRVGLPAKSGVSGGLLAVSPGRFGIACYSPPLDAAGNPVRAVAAMRELSGRFGLHLLRNPAPGAPTVIEAVAGDAGDAGDGASDGRPARVVVQGTLDFTAAERVVRALAESVPDRPGRVLLDLDRVTGIGDAPRTLLGAVLERIAQAGHQVSLIGPMASRFRDYGELDPSGAALAWTPGRHRGWAAEGGFGRPGPDPRN